MIDIKDTLNLSKKKYNYAQGDTKLDLPLIIKEISSNLTGFSFYNLSNRYKDQGNSLVFIHLNNKNYQLFQIYIKDLNLSILNNINISHDKDISSILVSNIPNFIIFDIVKPIMKITNRFNKIAKFL